MQDDKILNILSDKRVLYAEDERGVAKNIIEILEIYFGSVKYVEDGKDALKEFDESGYDVLIFDIFMPNLDGIDAIKAIRKRDKKIPIIIISAHTEQEYLWRAIELKITKYLAKPCGADEIISALKSVSEELSDHKESIEVYENCIYRPYLKSVKSSDTEYKLSKNESRLLEYFLKHKNRVITYDTIYNYLWSVDLPSKDAIKFIVKELRKKLGKKDIIENIYGMGYKFCV